MPSVFEQPWVLLIAAIIVFLVVGTWRACTPDKNRWWQWCLPLIVVLLAFALDGLVATDREKIQSVLKQSLQSVATENDTHFAQLIAPDYQDARHTSREQLLIHIRSGLAHSPIQKLSKISQEIDSLRPREAVIRLFMGIVLEEDSQIASMYKRQFLVLIRLHLTKQPDNNWLISRIDLLEVDKQPVHWNQIPSQAW